MVASRGQLGLAAAQGTDKGRRSRRGHDGLDGQLVVEPRGSRSSERIASRALEVEHRRVRRAQLRLEATGSPTTSLSIAQWGLHNTGQFGGKAARTSTRPRPGTSRPAASVTVAVIDTGIAYKHPDLVGNIWTNPGDPVNGIDNDGNGFVDDVRGIDFVNDDSDPDDDARPRHARRRHHRRRRATTRSASRASTGTRTLMALKFLDENGEGNTADAAEAIDYAVAHGARVVNASWGGPAFSQALYRRSSAPASAGCCSSPPRATRASTPTRRPTTRPPSTSPTSISVAATDRSDQLLDFSNYGAHVRRPRGAGRRRSTRRSRRSAGASGYATFSGTSMAAPFVSGAAALYLSQVPDAHASTRCATRCCSGRPPADAGGKDRQRRPAERRADARRRSVARRPRPARDTTPPSAFP